MEEEGWVAVDSGDSFKASTNGRKDSSKWFWATNLAPVETIKKRGQGWWQEGLYLLVSSLSYSSISIDNNVQPANPSPHSKTLPAQMYSCSPSQKGDGFLLLFITMELEAVKSERDDNFMREGAWALPPSQMVDLCHLQDFSRLSRKRHCTAVTAPETSWLCWRCYPQPGAMLRISNWC